MGLLKMYVRNINILHIYILRCWSVYDFPAVDDHRLTFSCVTLSRPDPLSARGNFFKHWRLFSARCRVLRFSCRLIPLAIIKVYISPVSIQLLWCISMFHLLRRYRQTSYPADRRNHEVLFTLIAMTCVVFLISDITTVSQM
jgi:hypothetical protein